MNRIIAAAVAASIAVATLGVADAFAKAGKGAVATSSNAHVARVDARPARLHPSQTVTHAINHALHECRNCVLNSGDPIQGSSH